MHTTARKNHFSRLQKQQLAAVVHGILGLTHTEQPSLPSWSIKHILLMILPRPTLIFWLRCSTQWFVSSEKTPGFTFAMRTIIPRPGFQVNNREQPLSLYSNTISVSQDHCCLFQLITLTNNCRGFTLFSRRAPGLSPVFNFTSPAYISFCLKRFGIKTWVNRRADSILHHWSMALHAEQTALGSNPADMSVFQTLLVSSLKSCNLAVGAERHSSKEKGSDTSYTVFWTIEHYFFTVFIKNALENTKCNTNSWT